MKLNTIPNKHVIQIFTADECKAASCGSKVRQGTSKKAASLGEPSGHCSEQIAVIFQICTEGQLKILHNRVHAIFVQEASDGFVLFMEALIVLNELFFMNSENNLLLNQ